MVKTKNNYIKIFIEATIFMYKVSTVRRKISNSYEQKMDWAPWSHCSIPKEKKKLLVHIRGGCFMFHAVFGLSGFIFCLKE